MEQAHAAFRRRVDLRRSIDRCRSFVGNIGFRIGVEDRFELRSRRGPEEALIAQVNVGVVDGHREYDASEHSGAAESSLSAHVVQSLDDIKIVRQSTM